MRYVKSALARVSRLLRAKGDAPVFERPAGEGSFEDFLAKLLAAESGLDPASFRTYVRDYESPVIRYPRVTAPGLVVRDAVTGAPRFEHMTVADYFKALGVHHLFDPSSPACIRVMQYAATNALGFVGYQFGESALISTGYYRPEVVHVHEGRGRKCAYESYYFGSVADATWRNGRRSAVYRIPGTNARILATDVNRWRGTFTGKNGIFTLADLKDPERQELLIRDHLRTNHAVLTGIFSGYHTGARSARCTWSAVLAAAHLCGPRAAAAFVLNGKSSEDEFKTNIRTYFEEFKGFETPYD